MVHEAETAQFEPAGVSVRPVVWAALASIALVLGAIWGSHAVYDWRVRNRAVQVPEQFPPPRVQTHQVEERQTLLAEQRRQLTGYAWADPDKTLIRIPIERAMGIIAQRGAEAYAPLPPRGQRQAATPAGAEPATTGQDSTHGGSPRKSGETGLGAGAGPRPPHGGRRPRKGKR